MNAEVMSREEVKVSGRDAQKFQYAVIDKWKPVSEVWHFRFGGDIAATMGFLSASYITFYFRRELKLRSYVRLTCYLPVAGLAALLADLLHNNFISTQILEGRKCPLCLTTKAALVQVGIGVLYPLVLAPLVGFNMADRLLTYPVPSISRAPKEVLQLWLKIVRKNPRPLLFSAVIQAMVIAYITQNKQVFIWNYKKNFC